MINGNLSFSAIGSSNGAHSGAQISITTRRMSTGR